MTRRTKSSVGSRRTASEAPSPSVDGRSLRRERNRQAVVDAVLDMFADEMLVPTIELASERSGLSLRSVYRYFPDPEALLQAAIEETWRRGVAVGHLSRIGEGAFGGRLDEFTAMRVRMFDDVGSSFRAAQHHAPRYLRIRDDLARTRRVLTEQFERQFQPEIDALTSATRVARMLQADLMSQFDVIDLLRRDRHLTVADTVGVVADAIRTALTSSTRITGHRRASSRSGLDN